MLQAQVVLDDCCIQNIPQSRAGRLDRQEVGSLLLPLLRLRVWGGTIKFYLFIYILFEISYEFRRKMVQVNIDR